MKGRKDKFLQNPKLKYGLVLITQRMWLTKYEAPKFPWKKIYGSIGKVNFEFVWQENETHFSCKNTWPEVIKEISLLEKVKSTFKSLRIHFLFLLRFRNYFFFTLGTETTLFQIILYYAIKGIWENARTTGILFVRFFKSE